MDYFTHEIIRKRQLPLQMFVAQSFHPGNELRALTATPAPEPAIWAFSDINDCIFPSTLGAENAANRASPREWLRRGSGPMQNALSV